MADPKQPSTALLVLPLVAIGALLATQYFAPKEPAVADTPATMEAAEGSATASPGTTEATAQPDGSDTSASTGDAATVSAADARARVKTQKLYTLENDAFTASFSNLNTALASLEVKGDRYLVDGEPYQLVTTDREAYLPLAPKLTGVTIPADARWRVTRPKDGALRFQWSGDGVTVARTWSLRDGLYQLESKIEVTNNGTATRKVGVAITSAHYVTREEEKGGFFGRPSPKLSHGLCQQGDTTIREDREDLLRDGTQKPDELHIYEGDIDFVALSSVYFAIIAAPEGQQGDRCELLTTNRGGTIKDPHGSLFQAELLYPTVDVPAGQTAAFDAAVYAGPKDFDALEEFGHQASSVVDLGWFSFIARGMSWLLRKIYDMVHNWGFAIILLTLLVRILLLPAVIPQFRNMAKQRALKPEIDKINERFKDNREEKGAAMMELWRKHKVNPLGGCLPVLLQMPIFFALYQTLSTSIELYHAPFILGWTDLSSPDPFYVLPAILGVLMFVQQKLTPVAMDPAQAKMMLYVMPLMMTGFMLLLPTGLCLYMVTSSAVGITQQRYMYWKMDKEGPLLDTQSEDETEETDDAAEPSPAATPKRAKPRRKKRPRRGRA